MQPQAQKYVVATAIPIDGSWANGAAQHNVPSAAPRSAWGTDLLECTSNGKICAQTMFLPWCTQSNIINRLDNDLPQFDCGLCTFLTGASICTRGATELFFSMSTRRQLLQRFNIYEPYHVSCVSATFCGPCSHCQSQRELYQRGYGVGGACFDDAEFSGQPGRIRPSVMYSTGLGDCSATECLDVTFCAPCALAFMTSQLNALDRNSAMGVTGAEPRLDVAELGAALFAGTPLLYAMRREFIGRYNVGAEDALTACLVTAFCSPCAVAQQRREMAIRSAWPGAVCMSAPPPSVAAVRHSAVMMTTIAPSGGATAPVHMQQGIVVNAAPMSTKAHEMI